MNSVPHVTNCVVIPPYTVQVSFRDGFIGTVDLPPLLRGPIFGELKQPAKFRQVTVCNGTLVWPNGADICPSVLRYYCEIGRVCTQKELDRHFVADQSPALRVAEAPARYATRRRK